MRYINKYRSILLILFIAFYWSTNLYSQIGICGSEPPRIDPYTIPHYGNSQVLDLIRKSIYSDLNKNKSGIIDYGLGTHAIFHLPIKVWIYHDTDWTNGALTEVDFLDMIDNVNDRLYNTDADIALYLKCAIEHINSTFYNNNMSTQGHFEDLWANNYDPKASIFM